MSCFLEINSNSLDIYNYYESILQLFFDSSHTRTHKAVSGNQRNTHHYIKIRVAQPDLLDSVCAVDLAQYYPNNKTSVTH